jgi:hypothetical protein
MKARSSHVKATCGALGGDLGEVGVDFWLRSFGANGAPQDDKLAEVVLKGSWGR